MFVGTLDMAVKHFVRVIDFYIVDMSVIYSSLTKLKPHKKLRGAALREN